MMLACAKTWKFPKEIGNFSLVGRSRAADGTAFVIPELQFGFDAGALVHPARPHHLFITHTHCDHAHMTGHIVCRRVCPDVFLPPRAAQFVERYLLGMQAMTDMRDYKSESELEPRYTFKPSTPGTSHIIEKGGNRYRVQVVECYHRIDCVGFCFFEERKRLKQEFQGVPGKDIAAQRKAGVEVMDTYEKPLFGFMGDTTHRVFEDPVVLQMPVVIVECTFFLEDELENADRTQHMHWHHLKPIVEANPNTQFILIHFSLRYTGEEMEAIVGDGHPNVLLWLTPTDYKNQKKDTPASGEEAGKQGKSGGKGKGKSPPPSAGAEPTTPPPAAKAESGGSVATE